MTRAQDLDICRNGSQGVQCGVLLQLLVVSVAVLDGGSEQASGLLQVCLASGLVFP